MDFCLRGEHVGKKYSVALIKKNKIKKQSWVGDWWVAVER